jgi:hypothetical protein
MLQKSFARRQLASMRLGNVGSLFVVAFRQAFRLLLELFDVPDGTVLTDLLGEKGVRFRSSKWSNEPAVFRSNPEWFQRLASLDVSARGSIGQPHFFSPDRRYTSEKRSAPSLP